MHVSLCFLVGCAESVDGADRPSGVGAPGPGDTVVEQLLPSVSPKTDVLLVVDDSCSTREEHEQLSHPWGLRLTELLSRREDGHLGVISMNPDAPRDGGRLGEVCSWRYLRDDTPDPAVLLERMLRQESGGERAAGLLTLVEALSGENPYVAAHHDGFLWADADLLVLLRGDRPDQSAPDVTAQDVEALLVTLTSPVRRVIVSTALPPPSGCPEDPTASVEGPTALAIATGAWWSRAATAT